MMKPKKLSLAIAGACAFLGASAANAGIGFKAGEWDLDFSGNVNAFYTYASCDDSTAVVAGGLACSGGGEPVSVRSGLLPSALVLSAKSRQGAFDVGVTLGFYPGINSVTADGGGNANSPGSPIALGTTGIDMRQNFLTFGDASWGTIKMGRDIGLFGSDAILSDMTLLGVGSTSTNAAPSNTSLGRIGLGYVYTDWIPQITYSTPKLQNFGFAGGPQLSVSVMTPLNAGSTGATATGDPLNYTANETPMFQAKLAFDYGAAAGSPGLGGKIWASGLYQQNELTPGVAVAGFNDEIDSWGVDAGFKANLGILEGVVYSYYGKGLGTIGLFILAADNTGAERKSYGGYGQLAAKLGATKIGVSYGTSRLSETDADRAALGGVLLKNNESYVVGVYHALTKSLNLVAEYIRTNSENHIGSEIEEDAIAVGAILFF